jgi:hypothetical protein
VGRERGGGRNVERDKTAYAPKDFHNHEGVEAEKMGGKEDGFSISSTIL